MITQKTKHFYSFTFEKDSRLILIYSIFCLKQLWQCLIFGAWILKISQLSLRQSTTHLTGKFSQWVCSKSSTLMQWRLICRKLFHDLIVVFFIWVTVFFSAGLFYILIKFAFNSCWLSLSTQIKRQNSMFQANLRMFTVDIKATPHHLQSSALGCQKWPEFMTWISSMFLRGQRSVWEGRRI